MPSSILDVIIHYQKSIEKSAHDEARLLHCIDKLYKLPVTVEHLQTTGVGKTVNSLRKYDKEVGIAAKALVAKWKAMVAAEEKDVESDDINTKMNDENGNDEDDDEVDNDKNDRENKHNQNREINDVQNNSVAPSSSSSSFLNHNTSTIESNNETNRSSTSKSRQNDKYSTENRDYVKKRKSDIVINDKLSYDDYNKKKHHKKSRRNYDSKDSKSNHDDRSGTENSDSRKCKIQLNLNGIANRDELLSNVSKSQILLELNNDIKQEKFDVGPFDEFDQDNCSTEYDDEGGEKLIIDVNKVKEDSDNGNLDYVDNNSQEIMDSSNITTINKHHINSKKINDTEKKDKKSNRHESPSSSRTTKELNNSKSKNSSSHHHRHHNTDKSSKNRDDKKSTKHHKNHETLTTTSKQHSNSSSSSSHHRSKDESRHKDKQKVERKDNKREKREKSSSERRSSHSHGNSSSSNKTGSRSSKDKHKRRLSHDSATDSKSNSPAKPAKVAKVSDQGIDSTMGTSFEEALGMLYTPSSSLSSTLSSSSSSKVKNKSKSIPTTSNNTNANSSTTTPTSDDNNFIKPLSSSSSSRNSSSVIGAVTTSIYTKINTTPPELLISTAKLSPLDPSIALELPTISPNYKPMPLNPTVMECVFNNKPQRRMVTDEEALAAGISSKTMRTKVYSGVKTGQQYHVPSLFDLCMWVLQKNIDALEYTGGVPFDVLKPVLELATPEQLVNFEHYNPYLMEDTDGLWEKICVRHCRGIKRQELETWREMYMRCQEERAERLNKLTENIKQSQKQITQPIKKTQLAYVDSMVKPPRSIQRKQEQFGTSHKKVTTPAARVASLSMMSPNIAKIPVRINPNERDTAQATANARPKKAPLMQKTLQLMKGRFKR